MQIQPASAFSTYSTCSSLFAARAKTAPAANAAAPAADSATISQAARDRYAAEFDTDKGMTKLDIDAYFTPPGSAGVNLDAIPLLLPSQKNIDALSSHISAHMPGFLADNGIPTPPASITYDNAGQIQLPADYPYAEQFKQALENTPTMERALRTTAALTSHMVEMNKSIPFQQEYAAAQSQAEIEAVVAKYSYLFANNRHYDSITLNFTADGQLSLTHDGKPLDEA